MDELIRIFENFPQLLHWALTFFIVVELTGLTGRSIFKHIENIKIEVPIKPSEEKVVRKHNKKTITNYSIDLNIKDLKSYKLKEDSFEPISLDMVLRAYALLSTIRSLSMAILVLSFIFYLPLMFIKDIFKYILQYDALMHNIWITIIILDILFIIIRAISRIGVVLYELHPNYKKTNPIYFWIPLYVISFWTTSK